MSIDGDVTPPEPAHDKKEEKERGKKKCGSEMADIISAVSYRYRSQDCVFNGLDALSDVNFDGSKASLEVGLGNCTAQDKLRAYGLLRTISFVLKSIPDLYECEDLHKIDQILILHNNNLLIRITNKSPEADKLIMQVEIQNVLDQIAKKDTTTHMQLVKEKIKAEFVDWVSSCAGYMRERVTPEYLAAAAVGLTLGIVSYYTFKV
jgi:hypothetical protein